MFERLFQLAEEEATSASRREFVGRFGRGALMSAAAVGMFLAMTKEANAGNPRCPKGYHPHRTRDGNGGIEIICVPNGSGKPRG